MKKLLALFFLTAALCYADGNLITEPALNRDSIISLPADPALTDSINIRGLVQSQIDAAQTGVIKSGMNLQVPEKPKAPAKTNIVKVGPQNKAGIFEAIVNSLNEFNGKYLNVAILVLASLVILGFVFGRRILKIIPSNRLKKSVNLIRMEMPVLIKNKKLYQLRKKLSDSNNIYDMTEETVSGKARNLNVGKGELILAAKIKAFQLSNISK